MVPGSSRLTRAFLQGTSSNIRVRTKLKIHVMETWANAGYVNRYMLLYESNGTIVIFWRYERGDADGGGCLAPVLPTKLWEVGVYMGSQPAHAVRICEDLSGEWGLCHSRRWIIDVVSLFSARQSLSDAPK